MLNQAQVLQYISMVSGFNSISAAHANVLFLNFKCSVVCITTVIAVRHTLIPSSTSCVQASLKLLIPHGKPISAFDVFLQPPDTFCSQRVCTSLSAGRRLQNSLRSHVEHRCILSLKSVYFNAMELHQFP